MLKFNLAPPEELESKYWWAVTVATAAITIVVGFLVLWLMYGGMGSDIDSLETKLADRTKESERLTSFVTEFDTVSQKRDGLSGRYEIFNQKVLDPVVRHNAVLILDAFHTLKPKGIWFDQLQISDISSSDSSRDIALSAHSFDTLLVAEFLSRLKSTANATVRSDDLVTRMSFRNVNLGVTQVKSTAIDYTDIKDPYSFEITTSSFPIEKNKKQTSSVFWPKSKLYRL